MSGVCEIRVLRSSGVAVAAEDIHACTAATMPAVRTANSAHRHHRIAVPWGSDSRSASSAGVRAARRAAGSPPSRATSSTPPPRRIAVSGPTIAVVVS